MKDKKNLGLLLVAGITLIIVTLGATYAYFQAQGNRGANIDTSIITGTTDLLSFKFGDEINIQANQDNFGAGMGNLSDSTTGTALLRAGDTTNNVDATYNIYLIIESNNFEYTTENQTPEILLNVTDPNGNPVENITGLVHYEEGFDITTRTGGFLLVPDYQISATNISETIQDWNIEVTFVNLDSDQNANTGKTLTGKLYMTQEQMSSYELTQINNIDSSTTYNSITVTPEITNGSGAVEKYYYGIEEATGTRSAETVEYVESDSANYEFTNLKSNTEYTVYSYVVDENDIKSNIYSTNVTTNEYENPTIDNVTHSVTLNSITVNVTASGGSNNVSKYMYKIDDNDWIETETNSYTFTNLTDTTEYDIRIKVVDSENHESTEYYEAIITEVYILPVVASVDATTTWNSITLTPSGTNGTNTIDHYEYSINNGAYQTSNVFSSLSENTNYTIKVKAIDSIGRESNVYETQVRTDTYKLPTISVSALATYNSITINVNATPGDGDIVSYHYSRDNGSNYTTSTNNSYTFSGLTVGTTYYLKVYVTDSNGRTSSIYNTSIASKSNNFANYIVDEVYTGTDGDNGLYYHDGRGTYGSLEAFDYSYRYSGSNPNNYVCFGSDEVTCPNDNLYRIIGVFGDQVKLIKATSIGNYYWYSDWLASNANVWSSSDIVHTLNANFFSTFDNEWQNKISTNSWWVGGGASTQIAYGASSNAKNAYDYEQGINKSNISYSAKIGLLYLNEYYYGAIPTYWSYPGFTMSRYPDANGNYGENFDYRIAINDNWIYSAISEWTITRASDYTGESYVIDETGRIWVTGVNYNKGIRPTFYLNSDVEYAGGTGTQTDPYRIS